MDDHNSNGSPPDGGTPPADPPAPPADTQEYITRKELDRAMAAIRRANESKSSPKAKDPAPAEQSQQYLTAADLESVRKREREIGRALSRVEHLTAEQRDDLYERIERDRPENVTEYVAEKSKLYVASSPTATTKPAAPQGRPLSDIGAPPPAATWTEDTPLWRMSDADREHLIRTKGLAYYTQLLRRQARGVKVLLPR